MIISKMDRPEAAEGEGVESAGSRPPPKKRKLAAVEQAAKGENLFNAMMQWCIAATWNRLWGCTDKIMHLLEGFRFPARPTEQLMPTLPYEVHTSPGAWQVVCYLEIYYKNRKIPSNSIARLFEGSYWARGELNHQLEEKRDRYNAP